MCTWSSVFVHDPNFNEETYNHDGSLICSECENVVMGCKWCSSGSKCIECAPGALQITDLKSYNNEPTCFYNFCGVDGDGVDHDTNTCISKLFSFFQLILLHYSLLCVDELQRV